MLSFLKQTRKFLNSTEPICIVLGNESCDLDSAVCAISLAYHYQQQKATTHSSSSGPICKPRFLPVLNIRRSDYPLKTEVCYLFNQHLISPEYLTFRDDLQQHLLDISNFILVDHHVSPFAARCIEVFDHRNFDKASSLPGTCQIHLEMVGSCATLIAEQVLRTDMELSPNILQQHELMYTLLHNTIVLDTVNFSESANRFTPKDETICMHLEKLLRIAYDGAAPPDRNRIFETLVQARADVSNLTASQLLWKDMKLLSNANHDVNIAIPGFPMPVQNFLAKPGAEEAIQLFAKDTNSAIVLLMGMFVRDDGSIQRDLGLININAPELYDGIREQLLSSADPEFRLEQIENCVFLNGTFYRMLNIKATRKHVLPILKQLLDK